jgi:hypothetical protein
VARGKLKNRTKTFLANPLCRGVDELCKKQAEDIMELQAHVSYGICETEKMASTAENVAEQCVVMCKENRAMLAENERPEDLVAGIGYMDANDRNNGVIRQYQRALMHYNELQSRSAGVES